MTKKIREKKKTGSIQKDSSRLHQVMEHTGKEIYENITQCLCLARIQLGNIDLSNKEQSLAIIGGANLLIGKAMADLRNLAKTLSILISETKIN